jgi:hypothetical protein
MSKLELAELPKERTFREFGFFSKLNETQKAISYHSARAFFLLKAGVMQ